MGGGIHTFLWVMKYIFEAYQILPYKEVVFVKMYVVFIKSDHEVV